MREGLNWGYLLVLFGAGGCVLAIVREAVGRPIRPWRLFASPLLATLSALLLMLLLGATTASLPLIWGIALFVGLLIGAVRGSRIRLQVDHMWNLLRLPRAKDALWITIVFAALLVGVIAAAWVGLADSQYRLLLAFGMAFCAGVLNGRAVAVALRLRGAPTFELRRL